MIHFQAPGIRIAFVRFRRALALVAFIAGVGLIAGYASLLGYWTWQQHRLDAEWHDYLSHHPSSAAPADAGFQPVPVNGIDFSLVIPKINFDAAVRDGVSADILDAGPGHYPQTPWPGQPGTVAVAEHNGYWYNVTALVPGDEVDIVTSYGTYRYRITSTEVVSPGDSRAVQQIPGLHLALTTCWPVYAGAFATQRYLLFANQFDPSPAYAMKAPDIG
jgi:LPXTG-site transpeptidase (sortase) family protein